MGRRFRTTRIGFAASLAIAGSMLVAPAANADFHFMKIREVFIGQGVTDSSFIELQMYAGAQTNVSGHPVTFYTADGMVLSTFSLPGDVANGENQRTILIGDEAVDGRDFTYSALWDAVQLYGPGGAACFDAVDCVSWGNFTGAASLPSPTGTPAPAIPAGSSLERSIAPNCATLLEDADDTNNSLADFALAPPSPRNNATPPTETACGPGGGAGGGLDTQITKKPKNKVKKRKVTYEFTSSDAGASYQCSENGDPFEACTSPHTFKGKKGKNEFEVRAVDAAGNVDQSPAEDKFKVRKKRKK